MAILLSRWLGNNTQAMTLLWSYNSQYDATGSVGIWVRPYPRHPFLCYSWSFLHKERNPVRAGGFQAATLFFMLQATVDIIDTMSLTQPIKKDGCSQKGLSLNKVSCRTSPINSFVILLIGTGGRAANFSSVTCCCTDGMC